MKKIYIISGERSGDMHASNLVLALNELDAKIQFRGMGGSFSKEAGVELALDYQDVALMGFIEVIFGFRKVLKYLRWIKKDLISYRPDVLVLVDFGGFNMKIASFAKKLGIPVHYYIPPKVWAWTHLCAFNRKGKGCSGHRRRCGRRSFSGGGVERSACCREPGRTARCARPERRVALLLPGCLRRKPNFQKRGCVRRAAQA